MEKPPEIPQERGKFRRLLYIYNHELFFNRRSYPNTTSSAIMTLNPSANESVP